MANQKYDAFLTVARLGSFKAAAEELGYTQAGISYLVNALEKELGLTLFLREYGGVHLTTEGREVLGLVQAINADEHALAARNLSVDSFARATEVESVNIIKQFAASGYGIAFLYGAAVVCELEAGTLARIPLAGHLIEHDITFIRPKGSVFGDEYARLFDDLRSV